MKSEKVLLRQWKDTQSSKLEILVVCGIGIALCQYEGSAS